MTTYGRRRTVSVVVGTAGTVLLLGTALAPSASGADSPQSTLSQSSGPAYGGFTTVATSTPLRLALYEPAIPVPASPQAELNFSYTHVEGQSGPTGQARASSMWPGDTIGEGLKTVVTQAGLPAALAGNGYPAQVNAQSPGSPSSGSQELFPGMVGRVQASDQGATARAGYSSSGKVGGDPADTSGSDLLGQLASGNLGAVGGLLGTSSDAAGSNPLGVLSLIVSVGGMSGSSTTDYSQPNVVTSSATSQLGEVDLLGGLVTLDGVTVTSSSTSSIGGSTITQKVSYGGLTIAGTHFAMTSNGIEADGSTTAIPGMPDDPTSALKSIGVSIQPARTSQKKKPDQVSGTASGPVITIDTQPIIKALNLGQLPLADLVNKLPSSAEQVQSLLLGALHAHPRIVVSLGQVSSSAQTVAAGTMGGGQPPTTGTTGGGVPTGTGLGVPGSTGVTPGTSTPPGDTPVTQTTEPTAAAGLPPLGSVPGFLIYGGLALAALTGWVLKRVAASVLGAGATCGHGLPTGLPDLRKAL